MLSLKDLDQPETFVALVMGAVLFTLLVQGLSIETLVRRLGLDKPPLVDQVGRAEGLLSAKHRAFERIPELQEGGLFSPRIAETLEVELVAEMKTLRSEVEELRHRELDSEDERLLLYSRVFAAEKAIYYELFTRGHILERVYRNLGHAIDHEADALRHGHPLSRDPLHFQQDQPVRDGLYKVFDTIFGFTGLPERKRMSHVLREYEEAWGRYQGCTRILGDLDRLVFAESARPGIVAEIRKRYRIWQTTAQEHIDAMAEQFPEFVTAVQERLARRLLVHAEAEIIKAEARVGSIPAGVRDMMLENLKREVRHLRGVNIAELRLDPCELLRKVPFFQDMPEDDFARIAARLIQRTIAAGKTIIR